jgi:hypothetical protein
MYEYDDAFAPGFQGATAPLDGATVAAAGERPGDRLAHAGTAMAMRGSLTSILSGIVLVAAVAWGSAGDGRVPFDRLPQPAQERLRDVVDHAVFERTVRDVTFRSRESLFLYFLDHPDVAAAAARALGVANYQVHQRSDGTYWGDDTRGAKGIVEVVYADPRKRVVHAQGTYDTKWLPTIHARIVLVLDFEHHQGADGQVYATSDVTGYLRVDNRFLDTLARLVGPIVVGAVDRKVARTAGIAAKVSERAYDDPAGFLEALRKLPDLDQAHLAAVAARLGPTDASRPETSSR